MILYNRHAAVRRTEQSPTHLVNVFQNRGRILCQKVGGFTHDTSTDIYRFFRFALGFVHCKFTINEQSTVMVVTYVLVYVRI